MEAIEVFPCKNCGKTFPYTYALKRHGKTCGAKKTTKCRKCLRIFKDQCVALKHELSCFENDCLFICQFCSKVFEHLYSLRRHYRTTHNFKVSTLKHELDSNRLMQLGPLNDDDDDAHYSTNEVKLSKHSSKLESTTSTTNIKGKTTNCETTVFKIYQAPDSSEIQIIPSTLNTESEEEKIVPEEIIGNSIDKFIYEEGDQIEQDIYLKTDDSDDELI